MEIVIGLLMYIGVNLLEHTYYDSLSACLKAKRISLRSMGENAPRLECKSVKAITEIWKEDGKKHIIKIIED
tara:strand:+ start:134 stop:349 length:216 start_codon:yes stop_codon:yes gene_type:complete